MKNLGPQNIRIGRSFFYWTAELFRGDHLLDRSFCFWACFTLTVLVEL